METLTKFKLQKSALRIFVIGSGFGFTAYCGLLCLGMRHAIAEIVAVTGAYLFLCCAAWAHKMCPLSWAFIIYTYCIRCCIIVHRSGWFGDYINMAHYIAFAAGAVLCSLFLVNIKKYCR